MGGNRKGCAGGELKGEKEVKGWGFKGKERAGVVHTEGER